VNQVTIVMYHYVRQLHLTRYPEIKGLLETRFIGQLDYLARHYHFVTMEECLAAANGSETLPANSVLLTFDDGYLDHYLTVFPLLEARGIQGCFFPPAKPIQEGTVLDVNKIHFILAAGRLDEVLADTCAYLDEYRPEYGYAGTGALRAELAVAGRFDSPEVIFIKRLLQHALPVEARARITARLFASYVTSDERAFAHELYMSIPQLQCMQRNGMHIGSHGFEHLWLATLTAEQQKAEIVKSLEFLRQVGAPTVDWAICYPYGSYDEKLLATLRELRCGIGFTSKPGIAALAPGHMLELERLDTNDLPTSAQAAPNQWALALG